MRKLLKFPIAVLILICIVAGMAIPVMATVDDDDNAVGFTVSPVIPENQAANVRGYFDLNMQPGQVQDLTLIVTNSKNQDIVITVGAVTASTSHGGSINYTGGDLYDESLPHSIADIVETPEGEITIPPNSTQNVTVTIRMPEEAYDGYLLGGINVEKQLTEAEKESGQSILNQYNYVIGLRLRENNQEIQNDFAMGDVTAVLINGKASIECHIHNTQPIMVKGMTAEVSIVPQGSSEPIMERTMANTEMAPNSIFPFTLRDDAGYGVRAGSYTAIVNLEYNGQTWSFEKDFDIKAEEAANINESAVNQDTQQTAMTAGGMPTWAIVAIAVGGVLLIVVLVLLVTMMKRMNKKGE